MEEEGRRRREEGGGIFFRDSSDAADFAATSPRGGEAAVRHLFSACLTASVSDIPHFIIAVPRNVTYLEEQWNH